MKGRALIALVSLLTAITAGNAVLGFLNAHEIRKSVVANCEEIEIVKTALRETIELSQHLVQSSRGRAPKEKKASEAYFKSTLKKFNARNCETSFKPSSRKAPNFNPPKKGHQPRHKAVRVTTKVHLFTLTSPLPPPHVVEEVHKVKRVRSLPFTKPTRTITVITPAPLPTTITIQSPTPPAQTSTVTVTTPPPTPPEPERHHDHKPIKELVEKVIPEL